MTHLLVSPRIHTDLFPCAFWWCACVVCCGCCCCARCLCGWCELFHHRAMCASCLRFLSVFMSCSSVSLCSSSSDECHGVFMLCVHDQTHAFLCLRVFTDVFDCALGAPSGCASVCLRCFSHTHLWSHVCAPSSLPLAVNSQGKCRSLSSGEINAGVRIRLPHAGGQWCSSCFFSCVSVPVCFRRSLLVSNVGTGACTHVEARRLCLFLVCVCSPSLGVSLCLSTCRSDCQSICVFLFLSVHLPMSLLADLADLPGLHRLPIF